MILNLLNLRSHQSLCKNKKVYSALVKKNFSFSKNCIFTVAQLLVLYYLLTEVHIFETSCSLQPTNLNTGLQQLLLEKV